MFMFCFNLVFLLSFWISRCSGMLRQTNEEKQFISLRSYIFWPNGTVPFFIDPDHFDHEQAMAIMNTLSTFAFKTCIKFAPVMAAPVSNQHVMVFVNPEGKKRCPLNNEGHSVYSPHIVTVGYECLQSPKLDMLVMKALGFPFEHNRMCRDVYIEVLLQNVEPPSISLFTKDSALPRQLRELPYDINSVMHFGERDFSKNGHRTIMFKGKDDRQNRKGLTDIDLRKIEIVYGPECRQRDRLEKIELCQSFPGVGRKKREIEPLAYRSLRVNPDITPPPSVENEGKETIDEEQSKRNEEITARLKKLGVEDDADEVIDKIYKLSAAALNHARAKYCNNTNATFEKRDRTARSDKADLLSIIETITEYTEDVVENALSNNLTTFCQSSDSTDLYQRKKCSWNFDNRCPGTYRSTKSGPVKPSTQHKPIYKQPTRHEGAVDKYSYDKPEMYRAGADETTTEALGQTKTTANKAAFLNRTYKSTKNSDIGTQKPIHVSTRHLGGEDRTRIYDDSNAEDIEVTTAVSKSRRKREVSSVTTSTSTITEKVTTKEPTTKVITESLKPKATELSEKIDKSETPVVSATTASTKKLEINTTTVKKHQNRRFFQERRYKSRKRGLFLV